MYCTVPLDIPCTKIYSKYCTVHAVIYSTKSVLSCPNIMLIMKMLILFSLLQVLTNSPLRDCGWDNSAPVQSVLYESTQLIKRIKANSKFCKSELRDCKFTVEKFLQIKTKFYCKIARIISKWQETLQTIGLPHIY